MHPVLNQAEMKLFDLDPYCWSIYCAWKYTDSKSIKEALWMTLSSVQQGRLRELNEMRKRIGDGTIRDT